MKQGDEFGIGEGDGVAFHAGGALGVGDEVVEMMGSESGLVQGGNVHVVEGLVEPVEKRVGGGGGLLEDEVGRFVVFEKGGVLGGAVG